MLVRLASPSLLTTVEIRKASLWESLQQDTFLHQAKTVIAGFSKVPHGLLMLKGDRLPCQACKDEY